MLANTKKKILVALSGGVDSSSAAAKLLNDGYHVEGVTLDYGKFCGKTDIDDAKKVAEQLGIKYHVLKRENEYEDRVIKYFAAEYAKGKTPNPCVKCNREVKFYELLKARDEMGFDLLATGHYARVVREQDKFFLEKAKDPLKDQSYFLSQIKYEYLPYITFPLSDTTKAEVRQFAKKLNLIVADKPESQDICFTRGKNYTEILKNYCHNKPGDIIHTSGKKLGTHDGIINYTKGQRKGLNLGGYSEPLFVIDIDAENNIVYVGNESELFKTTLKINNVNFLNSSLEFDKGYEFEVKLRSTQSVEKAVIVFKNDLTADVSLLEPSRNISKGQLCCMYLGNRVMASGFIQE